MPYLMIVFLLTAAEAAAQVQSRPTDPPLVTAANESWYQLREPIQFAGELYYRAGPIVFFNGGTMVRTGHYNGVPLYADTTLEPFSVVLVPVTRGLMQPYERLRRGELAGTTGSRPPSLPVQAVPDATRVPMAAVSPTAPPLPPGAISVYTPEMRTPAASPPRPEVVGTTGVVRSRGAVNRPVIIARRPENNDGIWIRFRGERWIHSGPPVAVTGAAFVRVGDYAGVPVYTRRGSRDVIYVQTGDGTRAAPYRLKR